MLFAVPDPFVCDDPDNQVAGCDPTCTTPHSATSYRNQFYDNKMGQAPDGSASAERRRLLVGPGRHHRRHRLSATRRNCWYSNTGSDGTAGERHRPARPRAAPPPNNLPSNCENSPSVGALNGQVAEQLTCSTVPGDPSCPWFTTPPKP